VPTYTFAWKVDPVEGGKYTAHLRVKQTDVPTDRDVIVRCASSSGRAKRVVPCSSEALTEQAVLRCLPRRPAMELSPFESVLAVVKTEGW